MHAKYALALILALQVSVSLCEHPTPSQELVDKYHDMKVSFQKRLLKFATLLGAQPQTQSETGQAVTEHINAFLNDPRIQALQKVLVAMAEEFSPMVDQARLRLLGEYEYRLRSSIGGPLNTAIETIKVYLDKYLPAE